jgi:perosamine synthetase
VKIPQIEPWIGDEEYVAIKSCFDRKWVTEGPKTEEFGKALLKLIGVKYGVFAPNGTLALYLGLKAIGIGDGDEVIVPDFTFIASATSVVMASGRPVFVGVNRDNFQIDLSDADGLVTKNTRAVMPVHMYGTVCNMREVLAFAGKHKLMVIEDAAQAIGVFRDGKHAGTFGDVGAFSFFADKTITTGEGGFVVTNRKEVYDKLLYLRNQGRKQRGSFIHPEIGYNFRITDIHSAVGIVQLSKLKKIVARKERILQRYRKGLFGIDELSFFKPDEGVDWIPFRVGILCSRAHELMEYMETQGIQARSFFYPLHRQPALKDYVDKVIGNRFENSDYGYDCGVCLPTFPSLTDVQIDYVCGVIRSFFGDKRAVFYKYYDDLYSSKDYEKEVDFVFSSSEKYGLNDPKRILEIGCGTGNHTRELAKRVGVKKVVAIDLDENMVNIAKKKLKNVSKVVVLNVEVEQLDEKEFDLVLAMFNVVTYASDYRKLVSIFTGVFERLSRSGVFIFDCWNGIAAFRDPPKVKEVSVRRGGKTIECVITPKTDVLRQQAILSYKISVTGGKGKIQGDYTLKQALWTPMQIEDALKESGLSVVARLSQKFPVRLATEKDWKILYVAKKD